MTGLLPSDPSTASMTQASGGPLALMRAAAARLLGWGGRRQVAIGVDDVHLLDDASSTVVAHLVTTLAAFVVMTVRSGEPLADVLMRLCKDGRARKNRQAVAPSGWYRPGRAVSNL